MVGYNQSFGSCVLHVVSWFNICVKFMKICQAVLNLCSRHKIVNTQRAITPKVGKTELQFLYCICRLMVFNICVKFHENMSSGFKLMKRTHKLLTQKGYSVYI